MLRRLTKYRQTDLPGELSTEPLGDLTIRKCFKTGQAVVNKIRCGTLGVASVDVEIPEFTGWLKVSTQEDWLLGFLGFIDVGKKQFELEQVSRLQRDMREWNQIIQACEIWDKAEPSKNADIYAAVKGWGDFVGTAAEVNFVAVLSGPKKRVESTNVLPVPAGRMLISPTDEPAITN